MPRPAPSTAPPAAEFNLGFEHGDEPEGWQVYGRGFEAMIDHALEMVHWFMALLGIGWGLWFIYCLIRFRKPTAFRWREMVVGDVDQFRNHPPLFDIYTNRLVPGDSEDGPVTGRTLAEAKVI